MSRARRVSQQGRGRWLPRPSATFLAVLVALALLAYFVPAIARQFYHIYELQREEEALQREILALQQEHERLQAELARRQGLAYVEKVAREELGLVRPGERAVIVVERPSTATEAPAAEVETAPPSRRSNWAQWWDYLFGPR